MIEFCEIIRNVSKYTENQIDGRYTGNASMCGYSHDMLITRSNIPKDALQPSDFVVSTSSLASIDTPVHVGIYKEFPDINYIIHGHAYLSMILSEIPHLQLIQITKKKYNHGSTKVIEEIKKLSKYTVDSGVSSFFMINLKRHGFIIGTNNVGLMKLMFDRKVVTFSEIK